MTHQVTVRVETNGDQCEEDCYAFICNHGLKLKCYCVRYDNILECFESGRPYRDEKCKEEFGEGKWK